MNVEGIRLINFRNYKNMGISFSRDINILVGKNAQGKTNILEAIYMCSNGRSFRTYRDKEIISFDKDEAYIGANIKVGELEKFTEIKLHKDKPKRIRVNKSELSSNKELNTGFKVVIFSPDDLKLIKDGPVNRRNYLDNCISQLKPVYNYNLNKYYKVLIQRNNTLKSVRLKSDLNSLLDVFDIQLANLGSIILLERRSIINKLNIESKDIHQSLTKGQEDIVFSYLTNTQIFNTLKETENGFIDRLKRTRESDILNRTTEVGPHRDDMIISINGKESKIFASQGQQRSLVLTMKLAEVEIIKKDIGVYPVLLLDDVFSELDEDRRLYLSKLFNNMQTFITVTDAVEIKGLEDHEKEYFYVKEGLIYKGKKTWREVNDQ